MLKNFKPLTAIALLLALLTVGVTPAAAAEEMEADPFIAEVLRLTNAYRYEHRLPNVYWNQEIAKVSQDWAQEQDRRINEGSFDAATSHRPDYGTELIPSGFDWATENIGINSSAQQVVDGWMSSPTHRAGMLNPEATDIGVGYVKSIHPDHDGAYIVVENLAGYRATRLVQEDHPDAWQPEILEGDIAAVNGSGTLYRYPSTMGGPLGARMEMIAGSGKERATWEDAQQLEVADWNADGFQDLLAVRSDGSLTLHPGLALGGFNVAYTVGASGWSGFDIEVTRWNRTDNYPGIIARNRSSGELYFYSNPSGQKHGSRTLIGTGWQNLVTFTLDYDGDGKKDVIAKTTAETGQLKLYRSTGDGRFISETRPVIGRSGWNAMTHLSTVDNHRGDEQPGILARHNTGKLYQYPIQPNSIFPASVIGSSGWNTMLIGS